MDFRIGLDLVEWGWVGLIGLDWIGLFRIWVDEMGMGMGIGMGGYERGGLRGRIDSVSVSGGMD